MFEIVISDSNEYFEWHFSLEVISFSTSNTKNALQQSIFEIALRY
jgi:hypothetical protein